MTKSPKDQNYQVQACLKNINTDIFPGIFLPVRAKKNNFFESSKSHKDRVLQLTAQINHTKNAIKSTKKRSENEAIQRL